MWTYPDSILLGNITWLFSCWGCGEAPGAVFIFLWSVRVVWLHLNSVKEHPCVKYFNKVATYIQYLSKLQLIGCSHDDLKLCFVANFSTYWYMQWRMDDAIFYVY